MTRVPPSETTSGPVRTLTQVSDEYGVLTLNGLGGLAHRSTPCRACPWRTANTGHFPPQAFIHSAVTAQDMSLHTFGCHTSRAQQTCAGFLLQNSLNNLAVRLGRYRGEVRAVRRGTGELFSSYRAMAQANGVPSNHPALARCRNDNE